jgi:hypothetical protein
LKCWKELKIFEGETSDGDSSQGFVHFKNNALNLNVMCHRRNSDIAGSVRRTCTCHPTWRSPRRRRPRRRRRRGWRRPPRSKMPHYRRKWTHFRYSEEIICFR